MSKGTWDIIRSKYVASAVRADQYPKATMMKPLLSAAVMLANLL